MKLNLKYKLLTAKEIRNYTVFAGLALTLYGCMMIWRSTRHTPDDIAQEESYEKHYLAPDTYLINAVERDSTNRWKIRSEIVFNNPVSYRDKGQAVHADLYNPEYARLPWLYTGFYTLITLLIIPVYVYLYRFVNGILPGEIFNRKNIEHLARAGYALTFVSMFYLFGNMVVNLLLGHFYNIHTDASWLHYDNFLVIFLIGMAGMVVQLTVRLSLKGNEIESEQNLTV